MHQGAHKWSIIKLILLFTVNPRISPLGAYLFFIFLDGGLFEGVLFDEGGAHTRGGGSYEGGGLIRGGGAYKVTVDIKKTLLKDLVYFSRNFFMSIY